MLTRRSLIGLLVSAGSAAAAGPGVVAQAIAATAPSIRRLKYGEFLWYPDVSPSGPVVIIVSLPEQLMHVYRNGIEIGVCTVSTGKKGHATPTGVFTILQKKQEHYSNLYNNAPMPYMQRLTWSGVAIHAGQLPGYPASHGCVRIPHSFSKVLFTVTQHGTPVIIADQATAARDVVQPGILLPADADARAQAVMAAKKKKPLSADDPRSQPASILVSAADRKGYFFRGGRLEATMAVEIDQPEKPLGNHLYSFKGIDADGQLRWSSFGLVTAQTLDATLVTRDTDTTLSRLHVEDREEMLRIASTVAIGASLVVTDFPASPDTRTGPDFAVVKSDEVPTRTAPGKVQKPAVEQTADPVAPQKPMAAKPAQPAAAKPVKPVAAKPSVKPASAKPTPVKAAKGPASSGAAAVSPVKPPVKAPAAAKIVRRPSAKLQLSINPPSILEKWRY